MQMFTKRKDFSTNCKKIRRISPMKNQIFGFSILLKELLGEK